MPIPESDSGSAEPCRTADRPVLLYDGDCAFCCFWVQRWKRPCDQSIVFRAASETSLETAGISQERLEQAVHLVEPGGRISGGAAAVYRLRELGLGRPRLAKAYRSSPRFARFSEWSYRLVARHRSFFSCLTRRIHGRNEADHDSA